MKRYELSTRLLSVAGSVGLALLTQDIHAEVTVKQSYPETPKVEIRAPLYAIKDEEDPVEEARKNMGWYTPKGKKNKQRLPFANGSRGYKKFNPIIQALS